MIDTLARYPSIAATSGTGTIIAKFANVLHGPLELIITIGTAIIVVLTAYMKIKEVFFKK